MAKKQPAPAPLAEIELDADGRPSLAVDPLSARIILAHVDPAGRSARNAPARDLTEADVARLAYREALAEVAQDVGTLIDPADADGPRYERPNPRQPDPGRVGAIVVDLLASGRFVPIADAPAADAPAPPPADPAAPEPAEPAPTPEG